MSGEPKIIDDPVFGRLEYDGCYGEKKEKIHLWDKEYELIVSVIGSEDMPVYDIQRQNYEYFKSNLEDISKESLKRVREYMIFFIEDSIYSSEGREMSPDEITDEYVKWAVEPTEVVFELNGYFGILCESDWDPELGIGIQIKPEWEVGQGNLFI